MTTQKVPAIDAHHHLWHYTPSEYDWIDESMAQLRRDFFTHDFQQELHAAGVDSAITVQARQSVEETAWLLDLGKRHLFIRGVVGWAPLASDTMPQFLEEYAGHAALVGLRHVVQGEPPGFLDGTAFNEGIAALLGTGLVYDIVIYERQLAETIRFVDRHPQQAFVLDHIAKPRIAEKIMEPWRAHMLELARRPNVVCKVSGMVTEADAGWSLDSLRPYFDNVVEAFGPQRLMAGSDWPVCLVRSGYVQWWETLRAYFSGFSGVEREAIFGGTAAATYL